MNIALFASGSGSNVENIARYFRGNDSINITLVLSNKADAFVLERAKNLNIPSVVFSKKEMEETESLLQILREYEIDFIVLAGFLLKIPPYLIEAYPNRIINIHPALLPKYGGKGMYGHFVHEAVVAAGEKESGITIHFVNEHYDEGAIIFQARCVVSSTDTSEDIAKKIHELEYEFFPKVIEQVVISHFTNSK
jgi:phosphoribosylglycinamide formyltransferase-1